MTYGLAGLKTGLVWTYIVDALLEDMTENEDVYLEGIIRNVAREFGYLIVNAVQPQRG